jgi:hypothetical protein
MALGEIQLRVDIWSRAHLQVERTAGPLGDDRLHRVAKSRSPWEVGVVRPLAGHIIIKWLLLKVRRSVDPQDDE